MLGGEEINYRFQMRRGWMASPDDSRDARGNLVRGQALRRKAVRMFAQGGILRWPDGKTVLGALADVTPDAFKTHRVWRYGLAWGIYTSQKRKPDLGRLGRSRSWAAQELERGLFGPDPNRDFLRALHVEDSQPLAPEGRLALRTVQGLSRRPAH